MHKIDREINETLISYIGKYPVISITGPRQSGKSTLCKAFFNKLEYVNLEDIETREFALNDPKGFMKRYPQGAIFDEIQRAPDLTSYIQVRVDEDDFQGLFVLTGSQNFSIKNTLSQSLAGRVALFTLMPFSLNESSNFTDIKNLENIMYTGFYPRIHHRGLNPTKAYSDYISTYVERDLRQIELVKDIHLFQKFIKLCAGRTAQILNLDSLANDVGISHATAREWITLLEASYIIFRLPPFFENIGKRLIKSPKIYFYDVGLVSYLLGIENPEQLKTHPLRGSLFETMVISEVLKQKFNRGEENNLLFYRDSNQVEVDLLIPNVHLYNAIEIKSAQTISKDFFKGLKSFEKSKKAATKCIIYAGDEERVQNSVEIFPYWDFKLS